MNVKRFKVQSLLVTLVVAIFGVALLPAVASAHGDRDDNDGRRGHHRYWKRGYGLCWTDKHGFHNRIHRHKLTAEGFAAKYDRILTKLDNYIAENNLTVENADALRQAVVAAGDAAKAEIAELEALKAGVDCEDPESVEANIDAYKAQLRETWNSLKDYKSALKEYKSAIRAAAAQTDQ